MRHLTPVWKSALGNGEAKQVIRNRSYQWLAENLHIDRAVAHMGFFDVDLCRQTVEICTIHKTQAGILTFIKPVDKNTGIKASAKPPPPEINIDKNARSGLIEPAYSYFDNFWFDTFKNKFGDDFWYNEKNFVTL